MQSITKLSPVICPGVPYTGTSANEIANPVVSHTFRSFTKGFSILISSFLASCP